MSNEKAKNERTEDRPSGPEFVGVGCCGDGVDTAGSCGNMREMMQGGPCAGFLKRHRLAVFTALTVVGLGFLILQVGWVLGVIAFFRTI